MKTIDLSHYHAQGTIVLSGRPKGAALRDTLNLDKLEQGGEQIQVVVPEEVVSLNSSFFSGLFGPSVQRMGEDQFRQIYLFKGHSSLQEDVDAGIKEALKTSNPLGKPGLR